MKKNNILWLTRMNARLIQGGIGACVGMVAGMAMTRYRSITGVNGNVVDSTVKVDVVVQDNKPPVESKVYSNDKLNTSINMIGGCLHHSSVTKEMESLLKDVGVTDSAKIATRYRSLVVWQPSNNRNIFQRWTRKWIERLTGPLNYNLGPDEVNYATMMYLRSVVAISPLRQETRSEQYRRHTTGENIPTTTNDGTSVRANRQVLFEGVGRVLEYYKNASLSLYPWIRLPWTRRQVVNAVFGPGENIILDLIYSAYLSTVFRHEFVHSNTGILYKFSREVTTVRAHDMLSAAQWVLSMHKETARSEEEMLAICRKTHPNQHDDKNITRDCNVLLAAHRHFKKTLPILKVVSD